MTDLDRIKQEHKITDELARRGYQATSSDAHKAVYRCPCPGHEDKNPSFVVNKDTNTFQCFGCDKHGTIIDLVAELDGKDPKDVIRELCGGGEGFYTPSNNGARVQRSKAKMAQSSGPGCTLATLAEYVSLPVPYLKTYGLSDMSYQGAPAVRIPYPGIDGEEAFVQYRVALEKSDGQERFRSKSGARTTLYGLPFLPEAIKARYIIIPEGASDLWTLRYHGFPAIALPSAAGWNEDYADALSAIPEIFVVIEPDRGGATVRESFRKSSLLRDWVKLIYMPEDVKDPNALHKADPEHFKERFRELMANAVPLVEELREEQSAEAAEAWQRARHLAVEPCILDRFVESLSRRGVAGEERLCKIVYLALVSRHLKRPVSVAVKGPSSGGKSFTIEQVLSYHPPISYFALSAMSDRALAYMQEPLSHRYLVIYEAAGMAGDTATYLIRSLLSEGCIRYVTVEKTPEGLRDKLIEREGPTGLLVTTTKASLHPENETRLLSLTVTDTPDQTRHVFRAIADESDRDNETELEEWRALQTWIDLAGIHRVTVPFAPALAELIPPVAVRLRRDFSTVLNLVSAHAILHQATREKDDQGRIVATLDDYATVRELVADLVANEVGSTVAQPTRDAVRAVSDLCERHREGVSTKLVAGALGIDSSSASRRLKVAAGGGYVRNLESKPGVAARWITGEPLPSDQDLLPLPSALNHCTVAPLTAGVDNPPSPLREKVLV